MKLDDELAAIKARVEAANYVDEYDGLNDVARLLAALELCRRQRDALLDTVIEVTGYEVQNNGDAALLEILRGNDER